jgi:hypothetical protein
MPFIVVVSKGSEFFFPVGACIDVVQSVQCDRGLVFL